MNKNGKTYLSFYKPYGFLSQFSGEDGLAALDLPKNIYACGRLDKDSEGLLVLTDDGVFQAKLSDPKFRVIKTYWAQVEGTITPWP